MLITEEKMAGENGEIFHDAQDEVWELLLTPQSKTVKELEECFHNKMNTTDIDDLKREIEDLRKQSKKDYDNLEKMKEKVESLNSGVT